ncbi:hypothetical protein GCM10023319_73550 [Nocardia iowensis]|uniref:Molybdopterin cofactor biosynthesis C (MoaC) domain-containing protein n=1 Tax=Nocardia iowensis TaxID=204891 RepID=A0ABX8S083_NOCIO|nr:hypothetical protein KV110_17205 [Nocardia iowensis]
MADGELRTTAAAIALLRTRGAQTVEVIAVTFPAGVTAAKQTSKLLPPCRPLAPSSVKVVFGYTRHCRHHRGNSNDKRPDWVEMEALTAVAVAGPNLRYLLENSRSGGSASSSYRCTGLSASR